MNVILHLGLGAFHRAHQASYLNRLIGLGERDWTIVAGNLRPDMRDVEAALIASGGEYTLDAASPDGSIESERIRAIGRVIPYDPDWKEIISTGAKPSTRIISFTVTEGGYEEGAPVYEAVARILAQRRTPVTLLSCDNLRANGERFRRGLERRLGGPADATFPSCMVDRITPRPLAPDRVLCERFAQWVIEDRFAAGRPAWEKVGVQFVPSVVPYEEAKVRILNASHSALGWSGTLKGYRYVHEAAADPELRAIAHRYVTEEVLPCLAGSPLDLPAYRDQVLERFRNPHLKDTLERICGDSPAKIRAFIAPNLSERLRAGWPVPRSAELAALYLRYAGSDPSEANLRPFTDDAGFVAEVRRAYHARHGNGTL